MDVCVCSSMNTLHTSRRCRLCAEDAAPVATVVPPTGFDITGTQRDCGFLVGDVDSALQIPSSLRDACIF